MNRDSRDSNSLFSLFHLNNMNQEKQPTAVETCKMKYTSEQLKIILQFMQNDTYNEETTADFLQV